MLDMVNRLRGCHRAVHGESMFHHGRRNDLEKEITMPRSNWAVPGHRASQHLAECVMPNRFRIALISGGLIVVLAVGLLNTQPAPLRAGDGPTVGPIPQAGAAPPPSTFVAECRGTLKRLQEKMAGLGAQVLAGLDTGVPKEGDVASQSLMVESAKARYQHAQLAREAAGIALKEYREGTFKQSKSSCEAELKLAQVELESAERAIPQARERYAKFKQVKTGSAADLALRWRFESGELVAQLQKKKAGFVLEQAQSKSKVLLEYEKRKNEQELGSAVATAQSNELAGQATWELEQSKLIRLRRMQDPAMRRGQLTDQRKRILSLLDRAIPIEEQLSARLDQIKEDGQPGDSLRQEITDLTRQLEGIVDQAQRTEAAAALGRLKSRLRRAAGR